MCCVFFTFSFQSIGRDVPHVAFTRFVCRIESIRWFISWTDSRSRCSIDSQTV